MLNLAAVAVATSMALLGAEPEEWTVSKHLSVAGQPVGKDLAKLGDEVYRFVSTDAGLTQSDIVTISKKGPDYFLKAAEIDLHAYYGAGGKELGGKQREGVERVDRKLTRDEWDSCQAKLTKLDFWRASEPPKRLVLDGMIWTLEGAKDGKYKAMSIHAPEPGSYRAACLEVWRTSGLFMGNWADKQQ